MMMAHEELGDTQLGLSQKKPRQKKTVKAKANGKYVKLVVADLRSMLKARQLSMQGSKQELRERLEVDDSKRKRKRARESEVDEDLSVPEAKGVGEEQQGPGEVMCGDEGDEGDEGGDEGDEGDEGELMGS